MLDRDERKPGDTERAHLALREPLEHRRADDRAGSSRLRQLDGVVETPRRAGSSVGRAGEDDVTVLRQARQNLRSGRRRGVRLAAPDHRFDAVLCGEDRADLVGKQVEVRLPVVDEADGAAGEGSGKLGHGDPATPGDTDRAQDANVAHVVLRLMPVDRASSRPRFSCNSVRTVRLIATVTDSTGSGSPSRWMTSEPTNFSARSSVAANPLKVSISHVSGIGLS